MKTIHDPRYLKVIERLKQARKSCNISQVELAEKLGRPQSYVAKIEKLERRLDVMELFDWLTAIELNPIDFLISTGLFGRTQK